VRVEEKKAIVRRAEAQVSALERTLNEARQELQAALALKVTQETLPAVAMGYRKFLATAAEGEVLQAAKEYSFWLAEKCHCRGPGAAADSGEARVCALLDELSLRLRRSNK